MKHALLFISLFGLTTLTAQTLETWTLADGRTLEAQVKLVTPGTVIFTPKTGHDTALEIAKLSETSRKRLIEVLGLSSAPTPPSNAPATVITGTRSSSAADATDIAMIEAQFGKSITIIGKVQEVIKLGSTGHQKLSFENSTFSVFISKRVFEQQPTWQASELAGKTVQVTGEITKYQEQLQIQIASPSQIVLIVP